MLLANPRNQELVCCLHSSTTRGRLVVEFEVLQSLDPIHDLQYKALVVYVKKGLPVLGVLLIIPPRQNKSPRHLFVDSEFQFLS